MDCRGSKLLGFLFIIAGSSALFAQSAKDHSIGATKWLAPDGRVAALTTSPIVRLSIKNITPAKVTKYAAGESLFHTPTLLGGQAAKAGISCASCHTSGRTNIHFQFPGVSGAPGTADVTHSFFSSVRGNETLDPVPIPDLTQPGKISHDPGDAQLEKFVRDLIVEEFDGVEPGQAVLDAISFYIRSLAAPTDENGEMQIAPLTIVVHFDRAEEAFESAISYWQDGDRNMASLLFAGARHQLRLMHERFDLEDLRKEQKALEKLGQKLGVIQRATLTSEPLPYNLLQEWTDGFSRARDTLGETADQSLYNPEILAASLQN
ncbi:hypothetical protein [Parasphingorhabdus sp.]|uniref:hypothetical protein n=1 Tax=Parasphingorhabdus sp. TaxID=2709688 RepID=UPI00326456FB